MVVVWNRRRKLSVDGTDAGSATSPELSALPVGGVVVLLVEDKLVAI